MVGGVEGRGRWVWGKALSIILRAAYAIGVLVYVAFYTEGFSLFQEVVVLLVAIIVYGAAESIIRITRGSRGHWWL